MLEILAPAGNLECANAAINNGANAVYLGYSAFSARQSAENFDLTALRGVVEKAHFCGVKVYVAMNTVIKDGETEAFVRALLSVWELGVDAIILQDIFLGKTIHETYPEIVLHLSTQAGICDEYGARVALAYGFSRVILARETPLAEIVKIAQIIETEVFVQGALCTCFSGQCYFSSFAGGNSGNRGRCKQPCRKVYAYDRNGNTEKNYALSLSDLCVGEDIDKLIHAGVTSFKIEGRMRRAEYVGAAVRYYRALLDKKTETNVALSDLKRTYNRGNYTKGLAFGQDKRFLSTAVQGHIGEKIGVVKVVNSKFYVESVFKPRQNDAFKILREGKEIGGAVFVKAEGKGFYINAKCRLKNGDGVFITTDNAVNERVLSAEKRGKIALRLFFKEGELPVMECGSVRVQGEKNLQSAQNKPLNEEELKNCFLKTDGLPVDVSFERVELQGNIFIPKSELNALRRALFEAVCKKITDNGRTAYTYQEFSCERIQGQNGKTAVIATEFTGVETDIAIYKPFDFSAPIPDTFKNGNFEKYLYYPAFITESDKKAFDKLLIEQKFDGIYAENYGGIAFAKERGLHVFAGTGFNLTNVVSVRALLQESCVLYYAISKELNESEMSALIGAKSFVLALGDVKVMDLCYCPFGKTCKICDKKERYSLTDENSRVFPVRRYVSGDGSCRFEVYNCASLISSGMKNVGRIADLTLTQEKKAVLAAQTDIEKQKEIFKAYTSGHFKRGVL